MKEQDQNMAVMVYNRMKIPEEKTKDSLACISDRWIEISECLTEGTMCLLTSDL
jgi:hypothetical protein